MDNVVVWSPAEAYFFNMSDDAFTIFVNFMTLVLCCVIVSVLIATKLPRYPRRYAGESPRTQRVISYVRDHAFTFGIPLGLLVYMLIHRLDIWGKVARIAYFLFS